MPYRSTGGVRSGSHCQIQPLRRTAAAPPSPGQDGVPPAAAADGSQSPPAERGPEGSDDGQGDQQRAADGQQRRDERGGQRLAQLRVGEQRPPVGRGARSAHQVPRRRGATADEIAAIVPQASRISGYRSGAAIPAPARQPMPRAARQAPAVDPAAR